MDWIWSLRKGEESGILNNWKRVVSSWPWEHAGESEYETLSYEHIELEVPFRFPKGQAEWGVGYMISKELRICHSNICFFSILIISSQGCLKNSRCKKNSLIFLLFLKNRTWNFYLKAVLPIQKISYGWISSVPRA